MEPRPRLNKPGQQVERRAERGWLGERAKTALAGLFALTTTGCNICFDLEHDILERQAAEQSRIKAEKAKETPEQKARKEFKAKLVESEKAGYTVEISGVLMMADVTSPLTSSELEDMAQIKNDFAYSGDSARTTEIVEQATDPLLELQRQLADGAVDTKMLDVPIYQFRMKPTPAGISVVVENWLTDTTVTTTTFNALSLNKDEYSVWESNYNATVAGVQEAIQRDKATLAETYGKLLVDNGVSLNAMDIIRTHPGTGMETLTELFAENDIYDVELHGFKHDGRVISSPFISWDFTVNNQGDQPTTGSPELPGTLTSVELRRFDNDTVPTWWQGHNTSEIYKDNYGNTVMVETTVRQKEYEHEGQPNETYSQTIYVMVPTCFLETTGSETEAVGWNVDLTRLGLPELTDFVYSHPERPIKTIEVGMGFKYNIYYQGEDSQVKDVYTGFLNNATGGVRDLQTDFYGYEADQQVVTNILIVPTNGEKNGSFTARNSSTIALTDAHMDLMESNLYEVQSTARHETAHALFNHLRLAESKPIFDLHKRLSATFFATIAEANWETDGFGGHPDDNTHELFATFINSLKVHDLEATMRAKLTPATAAEYADVAKTFREELTKPLKSQNSPYETIQILEKLTEAENIANRIAAGQ
ncbi:MAG: hypothetical protein ACD_43C00146G0003 [uncultured bacterium]|nr:MAG: hypothetical protein ACD_43C00146G0003 [uncultured bacterium]